jgi:hypothetical protein
MTSALDKGAPQCSLERHLVRSSSCVGIPPVIETERGHNRERLSQPIENTASPWAASGNGSCVYLPLS